MLPGVHHRAVLLYWDGAPLESHPERTIMASAATYTAPLTVREL